MAIAVGAVVIARGPLAGACRADDGDDQARVAALERALDRLRPLSAPLGVPRPGDWLAEHEEDGQTFREYQGGSPRTVTGARKRLCYVPLGDFTPEQKDVVERTAKGLEAFFGVPVEALEPLPLDEIPARARRVHPEWGMDQILSTYVLDRVLKPRLPRDAVALIALSATDLWPGEGWNFVFGQASLRDRVGVWSIYRNGDPSGGEAAFRLCLLRTMKTAAHETGHMLSIEHCTAYECVMNGSNHQEESDRQPLAPCAECLAKLCYATRREPAAFLDALARWCEGEGFASEAAGSRRALERLKGRAAF
jgi:archaemetzincin